jgi:hypothetical protein
MRLGVTRAVGYLCCVGAFVFAACADGGGAPTGATATGTATSASATGSAASDAATAKAGGKPRPFDGSLVLTIAAEPEFLPPSTLSIHFTGTGTATHLGRFTATFDVLIDVANEPLETSSGTMTLRAANGDSIFGTVTGHATVEGDVTTIVETVAVTGGTGRFGDAAGTFVINRQSNALELLPGAMNGTISY